MSCAECFRQHEHTWDLALKHRFLFDCQHATIRRSQFDTWLVQDYLFVREFTRLAAVLLSKAPYSDFDVILGGIVALKSELTWFQEQAVKRNLSLDAKQQEANVQFCLEACHAHCGALSRVCRALGF